jgi:hypothetical protein
MQLGGKTVCVEVEVVDAPLDYNILLGQKLDLCDACGGCHGFSGLVLSA